MSEKKKMFNILEFKTKKNNSIIKFMLHHFGVNISNINDFNINDFIMYEKTIEYDNGKIYYEASFSAFGVKCEMEYKNCNSVISYSIDGYKIDPDDLNVLDSNGDIIVENILTKAIKIDIHAMGKYPLRITFEE